MRGAPRSRRHRLRTIRRPDAGTWASSAAGMPPCRHPLAKRLARPHLPGMAERTRSTLYDGVTVYLPEVGALQPGDVLLTRNEHGRGVKGPKSSELIRRATGGRFSHALICTSPPTFLEATTTGVATISLTRCFAHDLSNVRVLRHPDGPTATRAAILAQYELGRDYSKAAALGSVFPPAVLSRVRHRGTFCSALVAQVFAVAGCARFAEFKAERTTPATLDATDWLLDVTGATFRPGLAPNGIEGMSALDGDRVPSSSAQQTDISNAFARSHLPEAERIAAAYPELELEVTPTLYGILHFIVEALDRADRVPPPQSDRLLAEIAMLDEHAAAGLEGSGLAKLVAEVCAQDDAMLQRNRAESFAPRPDIDVPALRGYLQASRAQLAAREGALAMWNEWGLHRSKAMTVNHAIDGRSAEKTRLRISVMEEILERIG